MSLPPRGTPDRLVLEQNEDDIETVIAEGLPDEEGVWDYRAGTSGDVTIPANGKVLGIACASTIGGAWFAVNGGDHIPLVMGASGVGDAELAPRGNLIAPTIHFDQTESYVVEFVT